MITFILRVLGYDHACVHDARGKSQFCLVCGSPCHC